MAVPQYRDEALVILSSRNKRFPVEIPFRRVFLTREKPIISVGRTSKRNSDYASAKNNAWFDSPVMSRNHAELKLDPNEQKIYIKDVGSLHGTFKNEQRLSQNIPSIVHSGDMIRFGVSIDRGLDKYSPCEMEATIEFGEIDPQDRPKVFRVPDDSDVEDTGSDDDHSIRNSSRILLDTNIKPAFPSHSPRHSPPIDLTLNDQYPISNVRGDDDYTANALPTFTPHTRLPAQVAYVDLSSPSPDEIVEHNPWSPVSEGAEPMWNSNREADEIEESDIPLSDPDSTDVDEDSVAGDYPASIGSSFHSTSSDGIEDYAVQDALDEEEDEFEEHDEFEGREGELPSFADACQGLISEDDEPVRESSDREIDGIREAVLSQESSSFVIGKTSLVLTKSTLEGDKADGAEVSVSIAENQDGPFGGSSSKEAGFLKPPLLQRVEHTPLIELPMPRPVCNFSPHRPPSLTEPTVYVQPSQFIPVRTNHSETAVEALGAKTGKFEYFAAREDNKKKLSSPNDAPAGSQDSTLLSEATAEKPIVSTPNEDSTKPEEIVVHLEEQSQSELSVKEPTERLTNSEWTASGTLFLNSPREDVEESTQDDGPVLDETSAYQFELSKKSVAENKADTSPIDCQNQPSEPTPMEINDNAEVSNGAIEKPTVSTSLKRKVGEISELTAENENASPKDSAMARRLHSLRSQVRFRRNRHRRLLEASAKQAVRHTSDISEERPTKRLRRSTQRLRRVAEVLGFAALGGVAVMSALIATAPTL